MKRFTFVVLIIVLLLLAVPTAYAGPKCADNATMVPGFCSDKYDQDGNGIPDAGKYVVGNYTALYAYDATDWYWNLGDGRVQGTVGSVDALDPATLTVCDYNIHYRADFGNDPFMNNGWISQTIACHGYDDNNIYQYVIVSATDPRFDINNPSPGWGENWRFSSYVISGVGQLVHPERPVSE